jgi:RNA polymerase sigma-70 factor (ECF subfamily)
MTRQRTSLSDLAERLRPALLGYLIRLLGNEADAQDACQETFLGAQRAFARLPPGANLRAWLYRIATNNARRMARRRARATSRTAEVEVDTLPAPAVASWDERERLRSVARGVQALPPRQRAALMLRQFQGLRYEEIAACLGGNAAGARANVYQAIKKLRTTIEKENR